MTAKPFGERPVNLHERKPVTMPLAMLAALLGAAVTATLGYAAISSKIDNALAQTARTAADNIETRNLVDRNADRIRALEAAQIKVAEMARDVEWLRKSYEEDRRTRGRPTP